MRGPAAEPTPAYSAAEGHSSTGEHYTQDFLDQLTLGEIRRILEGCALDDLTTVVPELVQFVAHSSHTPATLTKAWSKFEEATRDVFGLHLGIRDWSALFRRDEVQSASDEDAMAIVLSYADDAWRLITRGQSGFTAAVPSVATTA